MVEAIWVDNLIKVFKYENMLYSQILEEADNKTEVIVKGDVDSLQVSVGKEQKTIKELNKLQAAREQIVAQIAKKAEKKPEELTITYLLSILPEEKAKKLSSISDKLKETIGELRIKNELNQKLLKNAIDYVNFSLNLLTQPTPQATQYGRKGRETQSKTRNVLDIKY